MPGTIRSIVAVFLTITFASTSAASGLNVRVHRPTDQIVYEFAKGAPCPAVFNDGGPFRNGRFCWAQWGLEKDLLLPRMPRSAFPIANGLLVYRSETGEWFLKLDNGRRDATCPAPFVRIWDHEGRAVCHVVLGGPDQVATPNSRYPVATYNKRTGVFRLLAPGASCPLPFVRVGGTPSVSLCESRLPWGGSDDDVAALGDGQGFQLAPIVWRKHDKAFISPRPALNASCVQPMRTSNVFADGCIFKWTSAGSRAQPLFERTDDDAITDIGLFEPGPARWTVFPSSPYCPPRMVRGGNVNATNSPKCTLSFGASNQPQAQQDRGLLIDFDRDGRADMTVVRVETNIDGGLELHWRVLPSNGTCPTSLNRLSGNVGADTCHVFWGLPSDRPRG